MRDYLTDIKIEQKRAGYIDGGEWRKPQYVCRFYRGTTPCAIPIANSGTGNKPTGQDLLDAMRHYIRRGQITEHELLNAPVRD